MMTQALSARRVAGCRAWTIARALKWSSRFTYLALQCINRSTAPIAQHRRATTMQISKDLMAASSTPLVLAILAEQDSYGYAILQRIRDVSRGRIEWTDGMLYPVLHRLERLGYIEARWEIADSGRRRKYYRITPDGRTQLEEERRQWQAVHATLRGMWQVLALALPASAHPRLA